jgi:hypothetical protein
VPQGVRIGNRLVSERPSVTFIHIKNFKSFGDHTVYHHRFLAWAPVSSAVSQCKMPPQVLKRLLMRCTQMVKLCRVTIPLDLAIFLLFVSVSNAFEALFCLTSLDFLQNVLVCILCHVLLIEY